ncbi:hypothetical protein CO112_03935 [Candidatus Dojkabacteria bacterium CG_4_9_14_3_um_filter_150_Dojkabacteria_WS6_41_13]|uniref:Bacterial Ig domain-containing protein n=1 Tax=Candidatus Dojkabacteria bacterium CG_4_10_14_0_2_um_filter_Dojkabacteria_WS6_41_15 TaxID=2014249 RepID=A0A2M7W1D1_9BACT|nr:MAG: hypothetical protein COZ14_04090 [Candidatus Dojkabacteria bacterium CG_4_10_14_3_um_filter_Dojkabacteria_WS6_41_9]PJA12859.1 MAG: hypothetical protein COX64_04000 [Candidatus Dojkabacteria bacterium CG_4_10_14_0_2_um_filter_Dojkabacteria_WS6_41_15]PJB22516.1 MAG: hypothetical protein CO112_03935 [Candidatus Dojkabacteria bacterium CG_4_9_14_3_um_filter_150_Dojkabacteria_WS6_41_13]
MPTLPAPQSTHKLPEKTVAPVSPPMPFSSSQQPKAKDSTVAAILFIVALIILCGLIVTFVTKSANTFKLGTPVLTALPATTNAKDLKIEGTAPKNATVDVTTESNTVATKSDKDGKFSITVAPSAEGKVTYFAVARKKFLFLSFVSDRSNEISTVIDRTAPSLKLVSLPKTILKKSYTLKGTVSEPSTIVISVNKKEQTVKTNEKNGFSAAITFREGDNTVVITAKDAAGNETATSKQSTRYATGSVYVPGKTGKGTLPDSAGELTPALNTAFSRMVAIAALVLGSLGFIASANGVWLYKFAKREV